MGRLLKKMCGSKIFKAIFSGLDRCELFGHELAVERYAVLHGDKTYTIVERIICLRCGREIKKENITEKLTRTELVQRGWFIEKAD